MEMQAASRSAIVLLAGDLLTLAMVTIYGFASHGEVETAGARMLTTFLPLLISWLLVAPFLGVYDPRRAADWRQLWRPFWAMIVAAPLAAWMRGMLLNRPIIPIFVVVIGGVSATGLLIWRSLYWLLYSRTR